MKTLLALLLLAVMTPRTHAESATTFTYQGQLKQSGLPATGTYDMSFKLFSQAAGGTPFASLERSGITVAGGLFQTQLDYGSEIFWSHGRWLEISVRPGGTSGPLTVLTPRQELTATPFAIHALRADTVQTVPVSALPSNLVTYDNAQTFTARMDFAAGLTGTGTGLAQLNATEMTVPHVVEQMANTTGVGDVPMEVQIGRVQAIASGWEFSVAIMADLTVRAWGRNDFGQTNVPASAVGIYKIAAGHNHVLGLRTDGNIAAWGHSSETELNVPALPPGRRYVDIGAGFWYSAALRDDGVLRVWGNTSQGDGSQNVVAMACGSQHILAASNVGEIVAWGANGSGQSSPPNHGRQVRALAASLQSSAAILDDGSVIGWGANPVNLPAAAVGDPLYPLAITGYRDGILVRLQNGTVHTGHDAEMIGAGCCAAHWLRKRAPQNVTLTRATPALLNQPNTFTDRVTITDANSDHDLRITDGTTNGNWHLQTLRGGNSGFGMLGWNGYWNTNSPFRYNPSKAHWRMHVDQRGGEDYFALDAFDGSTYRIAWRADAANGHMGIGKAPDAGFRLDVNGLIRTTGAVNTTSDRRYKQDIQPLTSSLEKISRLRGVSYDWNRAAYPDKNFPAGRQIGFIAQDVQDVLPELVTADSTGHLSVAYTAAVPVLVEAVKELRAENAELKARLERIEQLLAKPVARSLRDRNQTSPGSAGMSFEPVSERPGHSSSDPAPPPKHRKLPPLSPH